MLASDALTAITGRRTTGPGAIMLLALLAVAGCAGMEPYKPHNHREEGPAKGVFSGSESEFVIFRLEDEPERSDAPESGNGSENGDTESNPANLE